MQLNSLLIKWLNFPYKYKTKNWTRSPLFNWNHVLILKNFAIIHKIYSYIKNVKVTETEIIASLKLGYTSSIISNS